MNKFTTLVLPLFLYSVAPIYSQDIAIDGNRLGRTFEGLGMLSAGASTRQLVDYPEPYRSDILDWLFKPGFAMALQQLKVEIGGDVNSTCGSEPSFAHTKEELKTPNYDRGYEYWLMAEARKRNPKIFTQGLAWGAPYWIPGQENFKQVSVNFFTPACADWMVGFLQGARKWGVEIDYLATEQNERYPEGSRQWTVNVLKPALDKAGFSDVKLTSDNFAWRPVDEFAADKAYEKLIVSMGQHYMLGSEKWPEKAFASGKSIWASEDWNKNGSTWGNAMWLVEEMSRLYSENRAVKYIAWSALGANANGSKYRGLGFLNAVDPWCGYYQVYPTAWTCAHITKFVQVGWKYVDSATGSLFQEENAAYDQSVGLKATNRERLHYVTYVSPHPKKDVSIIIVNTSKKAHKVTFELANVSTLPIQVWQSNEKKQFVHAGTIQRSGSRLEFECAAETVYTLTTTTRQKKNKPPHPIPVKRHLTLPYMDNFDSYTVIGQAPKYSQDQVGSFEIYSGQGRNKVLRQMSPQKGLLWDCDAYPCTMVGTTTWKNYEVSSDVLIEDQGTAGLWARVTVAQSEGLQGYALWVDEAGQWKLHYETLVAYKPSQVKVLATGQVAFPANQWHKLKLRCGGQKITAWIDGKQVAEVTDTTGSSGAVGYSTGYNYAQFDNLSVTPLPGQIPHDNMTATATSSAKGYEADKAIDYDPGSLWRTEWNPLPPMPQSLTVELGETYLLNEVRYGVNSILFNIVITGVVMLAFTLVAIKTVDHFGRRVPCS